MANQPQVELIRSSRLAARAPYAYAAVARDCSRLVFTAGACPLDESGETVAVGDVTGQAEQVMANLLPWTLPTLASGTWSKQPSTLRATTRPICSLHGRSSAATSVTTTQHSRRRGGSGLSRATRRGRGDRCAPLSLHEVERPRGQGDSAFPARLSPRRSSAAGCSGLQSLRARQCA
jgi:hypothetical protein